MLYKVLNMARQGVIIFCKGGWDSETARKQANNVNTSNSRNYIVILEPCITYAPL